jgi:hypothetical protein
VDAEPRRAGAGGSIGRDGLIALGQAAVLGFDPSRLLRADPVERDVLLRAVGHAHDYVEFRDRWLAHQIIVELSQAMKRGK